MKFRLIGFCVVLSSSAFSQTCECPLKDGRFKTFNEPFSHHSPLASSVILSSTDSVKSVSRGEVILAFKHEAGKYSVVVRLHPDTVVAYRNMLRAFVKKGDHVLASQPVGITGTNEAGEFEIEFNLFILKREADSRKLLACQ